MIKYTILFKSGERVTIEIENFNYILDRLEQMTTVIPHNTFICANEIVICAEDISAIYRAEE